LSIDDLSSEIGGQQRARLMQALRLFDRNQNGVLDADERAALLRVLRGNN